MFLTAGQVSDYTGARKLLEDFPAAKHLLAPSHGLQANHCRAMDRGYDADWFRDGLLERGITPCIPPRKNRKRQIVYDKALYKQRHKVENMFGRLKDWRRISTRYDRCAHTFFSAICIAAFVIYWI